MLEVIQDLRDQIDKIDDEILVSLANRLELAKQIGEIKKQNHQKVTDEGREKAIIHRLSQKGKLTQAQLEQIYERIFALTKQIQKEK